MGVIIGYTRSFDQIISDFLRGAYEDNRGIYTRIYNRFNSIHGSPERPKSEDEFVEMIEEYYKEITGSEL